VCFPQVATAAKILENPGKWRPSKLQYQTAIIFSAQDVRNKGCANAEKVTRQWFHYVAREACVAG